MDEVSSPDTLLKCLSAHEERIPETVTIIAAVNPYYSDLLPTLPESVLHVHLAIAYRSTNAITSLAQFIVKAENNATSGDIPVSELGSDVEGIKPKVFDAGKDEVQFKNALERCHELMGNNVTLLFESRLPGSMDDICESYGKRFGGLWECYNVNGFYGWEADKVVVVTCGTGSTLEEVTRVRTQLILILVESEDEDFKYFIQIIKSTSKMQLGRG